MTQQKITDKGNEKSLDDAKLFMKKIFEKEYSIKNLERDVIKTLLKNMGVDKNRIESISDQLLSCYDTVLRKTSRRLNNNFYLIAFMDMSYDYHRNGEILEYILNSGFLNYKLPLKKTLEEKISIEDGKPIEEKRLIDAKIVSLIYLAKYDNFNALELLINKGVDINADYFNEKTALMYASKNGCLNTVELLIKKQVIINQKRTNQKTALMYASENGHIGTVKLLLEKGADVNIIDSHNKTALMYASENKLSTGIQLFIEKNDNQKDYDLKNTLISLLENGSLETIQSLIEKVGIYL